MKKLLPKIGLFLGTFIVLNVAMFFLLKIMQPAVPTSDAAMAHDSTAQDSTHAASADSTVLAEYDSVALGVATIAETDSLHTALDTAHAQSSQAEPAPEALKDTTADAHDSQTGQSEQANDLASEDTTATGDEPALETAVSAEDEGKSEQQMAKLAKVLEGMKPAEAAVIAERLSTDTIVQLVMRMKARAGAKMMASLPVPIAASVAERMAELSGAKKSS